MSGVGIGEVMWADRVTQQTLLGVYAAKFPLDHGNCFSVDAGGRDYKIVNFVLENLEYALREGKVSWPIKIKTLSERHAVVHDERFPDDWFQMRFCEMCCPRALLPVTQLLTHERQIARGERKETEWSIMTTIGKRLEW